MAVFFLPSKIVVIRQKLGVAGPPEPPLWSVLRRRQEIFLTFYFWAEDFLKSFVKRIKINEEESWAPASCNADVVSVRFSEEDSEERPQCGRGSGSGTQQQDGRRQSLSCDCSWSINRRTIDYRDWTQTSWAAPADVGRRALCIWRLLHRHICRSCSDTLM